MYTASENEHVPFGPQPGTWVSTDRLQLHLGFGHRYLRLPGQDFATTKAIPK